MKRGKSEVLGFDFSLDNLWRVANYSGAYHGLLRDWWKHFGLHGYGLLVGEAGDWAGNVKDKLVEDHPEIDGIFSVDLEAADIVWDIQQPMPKFKLGFEGRFWHWIICQAVLEHLPDPFGGLRHMVDVLRVGGLLYLHNNGPATKEHRHPIDCCRFMRDVVKGWAGLLGNVEVEDMLWTSRHVFAVYRKVNAGT